MATNDAEERAAKSLCDYVERQVTWLLGDSVVEVRASLRDHNYFIGVGIRTHEGYRHAIGGLTAEVALNPEAWAEATHVALVTWMQAIREYKATQTSP